MSDTAALSDTAAFFANKKKVEERKAMKMTDVITSITKKEFPPNQLFIILEVILRTTLRKILR